MAAGVWFRKCLRLHDNEPLVKAVASGLDVVPFFILDPHFDKSRVGVNRFNFLLQSLKDLDGQLRGRGSRLLVFRGQPEQVLVELFGGKAPVRLSAIFWEADTEPYARARDERVLAMAKEGGVHAEKLCGHTLLDIDATVAKPGFKPPISMKSIQTIVNAAGPFRQPFDVPKIPPLKIEGHQVPDISELYDEEPSSQGFPGGETEALARLQRTCSDVQYVCSFEKPKTASTGRPGCPWEPSTTGLSPYLKFGCLSVRTAWYAIDRCIRGKSHSQPPQSLHGQLLFREMFYLLGAAVPNFDRNEGNSMCKMIAWGCDENLLAAWEAGKTGYPFIDALMRQLKQTGFMHHLGRHAVACFLTRGDLWQNWTAGRDVFDRLLLDADWAVNNGNWLWLAGVAPFSAPYFRIYDPCPGPKSSLNADQTGEFVKHYVPELQNMPAKYLYKPWTAPVTEQKKAGCIIGEDYPKPIVDHQRAREENLAKFKAALDAKGGELPAKFGGAKGDPGPMRSSYTSGKGATGKGKGGKRSDAPQSLAASLVLLASVVKPSIGKQAAPIQGRKTGTVTVAKFAGGAKSWVTLWPVAEDKAGEGALALSSENTSRWPLDKLGCQLWYTCPSRTASFEQPPGCRSAAPEVKSMCADVELAKPSGIDCWSEVLTALPCQRVASCSSSRLRAWGVRVLSRLFAMVSAPGFTKGPAWPKPVLRPARQVCKAQVGDGPSMDVPLSYALWPVAVRLSSIRKAVKGQKVARKQLQRNLQRAQQEGDQPDAGEVELQELEDIGDLEEMDEDVEDFVDLDDAELAGSTTSLEGQSFFQEGDLDQELRRAADMLPEAGIFDQEAHRSLDKTKLAKASAVVEALLSESSRSWTCGVEREPAILEDRPNPDGSFVAVLAHGLESVVELRGRLVPLSALPAKQRRALRRVVQPDEVNWKALPPFVPAHEDKRLERLALDSDCRYFSSTSSLTGLLSRCYFAISQHRQFDPCGLSKGYRSRPRTFSPSTRWPTVSYLRRTSGTLWSLTAAKDDPEDKTVLLDLGKSMEYQLTMSKNDFNERFLKNGGASTEVSSTEQEKDNQAYRFLKVDRLMMRSQLDAIYQGLVFDVKTRAVSAVRHDAQNYEKRRKYRITRIFGARNSYELEIYEMMRNAFMKYGFQAKIGRMDGVIVAYHNTSEIFGFQYIPLADMERCIYGGREAADVAFDLSVKVLQTLLDFLTQDEDLAKHGTIKMRVSCEESANSDLGNALDVSAAPVLKEGGEAEVDELGTARHFRLLVNTFHGDGTRRKADEALQTGDYVEVTFTEVDVNAFLETRGESGTKQAQEEWSPWQALQDLASAILRAFQGGDEKRLVGGSLLNRRSRRRWSTVGTRLLRAVGIEMYTISDKHVKFGLPRSSFQLESLAKTEARQAQKVQLSRPGRTLISYLPMTLQPTYSAAQCSQRVEPINVEGLSGYSSAV
eukprot:s1483_g10.t5